MTEQKTVYIRNIDYYTTEEELSEFLKEYNVVHVLIPNHTVVFRSGRKPLGIAYAEFQTQKEAEVAIAAITKTTFNGRVLLAKLHVPFIPKFKLAQTEAPEAETKASSEVKEEKSEEIKPAVSEDTLFIPHLHYKATDQDLREYFSDYKPLLIYVFIDKNNKKSIFRSKVKNALVTLEAGKPLEQVIEELKSKKLMGRYVILRAAYLSKLEKVIVADQKKKEKVPTAPLSPVAEVSPVSPTVEVAPVSALGESAKAEPVEETAAEATGEVVGEAADGAAGEAAGEAADVSISEELNEKA